MSNGYNGDRYSPSLTGDIQSWKRLIDLARAESPREVFNRASKAYNNRKDELDFKEDGTDYILRSESERIKTLPELIEAMDIDEEAFSIYRTIHNKYDQHSVEKGLVELYQVKAWAKRLYPELPDPAFLDKWMDELEKDINVEKPRVSKPKPGKPIVVALADLHTGGFSEGDALIPDYNVEEVRKRLHYVAEVANSYGRPVHVKILGDFIESFTGKNHGNTWKQIEKHGMEAALCAFDIVKEFLLKLENFESIDIIGGNHDRISKHWGEDKQGQVAYLVEGLLDRFIDYISSDFSPILMSKVHDKLCYIISHGDKRISKTDASELVLKYGEQDLYNVLLYAHGHEEKTIKSTNKLRVQQIPPICTPNKFAVEQGYDGASGFVVLESNDFGGVDIVTKGL